MLGGCRRTPSKARLGRRFVFVQNVVQGIGLGRQFEFEQVDMHDVMVVFVRTIAVKIMVGNGEFDMFFRRHVQARFLPKRLIDNDLCGGTIGR